jgi:hypothetical protein
MGEPVQKMKLLPLLTIGLILAGCAASPTEVKIITTVPAARIFAKELLAPTGGRKIPVTITMDQGGTSSTTLKINSRDVAKLAPGETLRIYLEYSVVVFGTSDSIFYSERRVVIDSKVPQLYRIQIAQGSGPQLSQVAH